MYIIIVKRLKCVLTYMKFFYYRCYANASNTMLIVDSSHSDFILLFSSIESCPPKHILKASTVVFAFCQTLCPVLPLIVRKLKVEFYTYVPGQVFGRALKTSSGVPASHVHVPSSSPSSTSAPSSSQFTS